MGTSMEAFAETRGDARRSRRLWLSARMLAPALALAAVAACGSRPGDLRRIEATVSGLAGVGLVLQFNEAVDIAVTADGPVTLAEMPNGSVYNVSVKTQPSNPHQTCTVANPSGRAGAGAPIPAVSCVRVYEIGGVVDGLALGTAVLVRSGLGDEAFLTGNGPFKFPVAALTGAEYAVSVAAQPTGDPPQVCTVENGVGVVTGADVGNLIVGCGPRWAAVSAGGGHTMAITEDGVLWAWGRNGSGRLGDGTTVDRHVRTQIGMGWRSVDAQVHTVGVQADGRLWAWGPNGNGQLGDNTTSDRDRPKVITPIGTEGAVSAGTGHTVAVDTDGLLFTWGSNMSGELGIGDMTIVSRAEPRRVGDGADWASVSAGDGHTLGLKRDGTLWGWGWNQYGQLGIGGEAMNSVAVPSLIGGSWSAISAGMAYSLGIRADGTLWAWGSNSSGALGTGEAYDAVAFTPTQVDADDDWKSVSAGPVHAVAIKRDGSLWAWGANQYGQLGRQTTGGVDPGNRLPGRVGAWTDWVLADAGGGHTVGIRRDGTLWAWGWNRDGQLGDGTTSDRLTPIRIR